MGGNRAVVLAVLVGALSGLVAAPATCAADDDAVERIRNRCILVLLDQHAGSAEKMDACGVLRRLGRDNALPAAPALARQTLYDMQPVRESAFSILVGMVGKREAGLLIAKVRVEPPKPPIDLSEAALAQVNDWDEFVPLATYLLTSPPNIRLAGAAAAIRTWKKTGKLPSSKGVPFARLKVIAHDISDAVTYAYPRLSVEQRRDAVALTQRLCIVDPELGVHLFVRALADEDEKARELAKGTADLLFLGKYFDGRIASELFDLATNESTPPKEVDVALKYIEARREDLKSNLVAAALERLAAGRERAAAILRVLGEQDTPAVAAAAMVGKEPVPEHRAALAKIFDAKLDPKRVRDTFLALLSDVDGALRYKAAKAAATNPTHYELLSLMDGLIERNEAEAPEVIRLLVPDAKTASARMIPWLRDGTWEQKRLAMRVLKAVGMEGEAVRAELNRVIESEDHETRTAAAELLGRQDVLKRARVPELLTELRSERHDVRVLAARQLDGLGVEPKEMTAALIRAVDRRDLAARVGLVEAIAAGHATRRNSLDVLKEMAERTGDPVARAYERAALREVTAVGLAR